MKSDWSERLIARAICTQVLNRRCIVMIENTKWTGHECDVLGVTMDLRLIDIEVKISRSDLKADASKEKWWERVFRGLGDEVREFFPDGRLKCINRPYLYDSTPRLWPPKVWKHYYAMPSQIWRPELAETLPSKASGVLLLDRGTSGQVAIHCVRRATPARDCDALTAAEAIDIARLANLRMHEAHAELEQVRAAAAQEKAVMMAQG